MEDPGPVKRARHADRQRQGAALAVRHRPADDEGADRAGGDNADGQVAGHVRLVPGRALCYAVHERKVDAALAAAAAAAAVNQFVGVGIAAVDMLQSVPAAAVDVIVDDKTLLFAFVAGDVIPLLHNLILVVEVVDDSLEGGGGGGRL